MNCWSLASVTELWTYIFTSMTHQFHTYPNSTAYFVGQELVVSEICSLDGKICRVPWTATPSMDILTAKMIMKNLGVNQVPVVKDQMGYLVGVLDWECIDLTCRYV